MKTLEFLPEEKREQNLFGVFETIKIHKGNPLRLNLHYQRMKNSCYRLNIGMPPDFEKFEQNIKTYCKNTYNFLKVTATKKGIYVEGGYRKLPENTVKLLIIRNPKINSNNPLLLHKTTDYSFFANITEKARKHNCYDGIILNEKGNVTQCGKCNIYFVKENGEIITPPLSEGVLPGIIRTILLKYRLVKEEIVSVYHLKKFKKCFVSNALIEVKEAVIENLEL